MDDDFFSDDEIFEALGESGLEALEKNAIQSTQAHSNASQPQRPVHNNSIANHRNVPVPATIYNPSRPTIYNTFRQEPPPQPSRWKAATSTKHPQTNPSNFGPTTVPTLRDVALRTSQPERGYDENQKPGYAAAAAYTTGPKAPHQEEQYYYPGSIQQGQEVIVAQAEGNFDDTDYDGNDSDGLLGGVDGFGPDNANGSGDDRQTDTRGHQQQQMNPAKVQELQQTIQELEETLSNIQKAHQAAETNALAKAGEVAIVRSHKLRAEREYERQLQSLQALQKEERERYERELKAAREETEKIRTRNMFLANDFEEVVRKNKVLEKSTTGAGDGMDRTADQASPLTTPRKKRFMPLRDGFDDDVILTSPKFKLKGTTPSKKRKRPSVESPVGHLPLSQARRPPLDENNKHLHVVDEEILQRLWHDDHRFDLFEALEAHRSEQGNIRTMEALSKYAFPSSPDTSLSSLFIDNLISLKATSSKAEFPVVVSKSLLSIWRGILEEKFWEPFHLVLDLLCFTAMWAHGKVSVVILDEAIDLIQYTVDVNAIPRIRQQLDKLEPEINTANCLTLLESIALGVMVEEAFRRRFWKLIRVDFTLMMLNPSQPLQDIQRMVCILCTGVFEDTFGPQVSNEAHQRQNESHILDAITRILVDVPDVSAEEQSEQRSKIAQMRKEILHFLGCLAGTERGSRLIIEHLVVLSRLVRRLSDELEEIYDFKGDVGNSAEFVNAAVRLLHGILITHPNVHLGTKLSGGATHKHLVAMTRLAFSERLLQEAGIDGEVVEYAYNILEMSVTPEEGEALQGLFASPPVSARFGME